MVTNESFPIRWAPDYFVYKILINSEARRNCQVSLDIFSSELGEEGGEGGAQDPAWTPQWTGGGSPGKERGCGPQTANYDDVHCDRDALGSGASHVLLLARGEPL